MKARLSILLVTSLLVAPLAAPGFAIPDDRTVTEAYSSPSGLVVGSVYGHVLLEDLSTFEVGARERWVTFSIEDATGLPVLGLVFRNGRDRNFSFCSSTEQPIRVRPYERLYVGAFIGQCDPMTPSVATMGTITATFSK